MSGFTYRAYISYSHRDERWAKWLHRALETYRVPRKLVGTTTGAGEVPARIRPIFRDRDDLSSSADLNTTVKQALSESENLIVICTESAVASRWVNEEIREFVRLGRQAQILCVVVDAGDGDNGTDSPCFPVALAECGLQEPLAADARKWADGKHLARLKVIAGLLGLPLDRLRRRDLQKRQKTWAMVLVASIAIAAILVTAVTARIAARERRDSGESLVVYKLNELRTMLNVTDDPGDLSRLGQWNRMELARLIAYAGVGKNALTISAMDKREQGIGFWRDGALGQAMEKFQESWALLAETYHRDNSNHVAFFELGQAEYWIGQTYMDLGALEVAEDSFISYAEITRQLILLQPKNAEWVLEMSFALTNLGNVHLSRDLNNTERTLQFMQSSLEYNQIALVLDPGNDYYRSELGQSHANLADAQLNVCDLQGALVSRQENLALDNELLQAEPENINRMRRLALALSGYASVNEFLGNSDEATESLQQALQLFEEILVKGVNIKDMTILILERAPHLAWMKAMTGNTEEAWADSNAMTEKWRLLQSLDEQDMRTKLIYTAFLLDRAWLAQSRGEVATAGRLLDDVLVRLSAAMNNMSFQRTAGNMLVLAAFRYWELNKQLPAAEILSLLPEYASDSGRTRSCRDSSRAVMKAVMLGEMARAREFTEYLLHNGYREADFIRVCKTNALCAAQ